MNVSYASEVDQFFSRLYVDVVEPFVPDFVKSIEYEPWVFSLLGSAIIGLAGILPLLVIPVDIDDDKDSSDKSKKKDRKYTYLCICARKNCTA